MNEKYVLQKKVNPLTSKTDSSRTCLRPLEHD